MGQRMSFSLFNNPGIEFFLTVQMLILAGLVIFVLRRRKTPEVNAKDHLRLLSKEVEITNQELKRVNQEKSDLAAILSHELRTPLMAIQESLDLILDGVLGPIEAEQHETLGIAKRNADRLARLIHHALDFETPNSKAQSLNLEETNVSDLVLEIHDLMLESLKKKGLRFTFTTPKKTVFAVCDQDMIRQLLINLLDNARKFTSSGGSVTLSLSEENDCVNLSVSDTGVGIKPEDQSRIFERYAQVTYKGPLKQGGAGVGLAVCHHIVEKHHGEILLQSTLGMGSSFTAVLPKGLALPLKPGRVKAQKIS